nr:unnamed protein product [Digitaria exilis]
MTKVAGGLTMAKLAFWLGWIALLQGCMVKALPYDYSASIEASPCSFLCPVASACPKSFVLVQHRAEASPAGIPA